MRKSMHRINTVIPVSILYKSIAGRYRPVRVADGPITARYRFIKNASRDIANDSITGYFVPMPFRTNGSY